MKLLVQPQYAGYGVQIGQSVISQKLDGGASRFEVDQLGAAHAVSVSWLVDPEGYQYLMAFYRVWAANPSVAFDADLLIDGHGLQTYKCRFMSVPSASVQGRAYTVNAQFEVAALPANHAFDQSIVDMYGSGGVGGADQLEQLANTDLPDALEGV